MQIRRQQCQDCLSQELNNILVREEGKPISVYVQCAHCGKLVAHYRLDFYYHHGKGIDSFLRGAGVQDEESGRGWLSKFNQAKEEAEMGFARALLHEKEHPDQS